MNQSNKILTVAYGTFSCTLEGFEDSFDTMKAIAEYFRDLAADDRYFGAEPPTPDAEMLARIAEKEIARRVEARLGDDGIHLRAATPAAAAAALPVENDPAPQAETEQPEAEQPDAAPETQAAAEPDPEVLIAPEAPDLDGEIAAYQDTAHDSDAADAPDLDLAEADAPQQDSVADVTTDLPEEDEDGDAPDLPEVDLSAIADAVQSEAEPAEEEPAPEIAAPAPAPHETKGSSVAAKLARIRQVVSTKPAPSDDGFTEDQHAATEPAQAEPEQAPAQDANAEDTIANVLGQMAEDAPADAPADEDQAADPRIDTYAAQLAKLEQDLTAEDAAQTEVPEAEAEAEAAPAEAEAEAQPEPAPVKPRKISTRVMKVKRKALEEAVASGQIEEVEDETASAADAPPPPPAPARPVSSLSDADEAELQAALAEVAAELDTPADAQPALQPEAQPEIATPAAIAQEMAAEQVQAEPEDIADEDDAPSNVITPRPGRNVLMNRGVDETGGDMSRLLDKADSEMAEPQGRQRRNAITHLRAAIAAARDDEGLKTGNDTEVGSEAYRNDLDEVVRPRRPAATGQARDARPEDSTRTAPLQLVAEQRVDGDEDATAKPPVRPRRVSALSAVEDEAGEAQQADTEVELDDDVSFNEFAEEMGAVDLPDLLEAAAAYMSFVEKRPAFSRPQLMTKVRQAETGDYTREDRLRSFGLLLREGKIQKTQGGQFTASERISFRPEDDRVAG